MAEPTPFVRCPRVLVVDDDPLVRWSITQSLERRGFCASEAEDLAHARERARSARAIVLDHGLPDGDGLSFLGELARLAPGVPVLMLTGFGNTRLAVDAMRAGAWYFLDKPFDMDELCTLVSQAVASTDAPLVDANEDPALATIVGTSDAMRDLRRTLARVANSPATTVLLLGESGTGKDHAARALHEASPRKSEPFVHITCSALAESLLESELFGHEAGAFTGADRRRIGLLEQARGGTVFLDEIGELSPSLQAKLLRFLEDRAFRRVGGTTEIRADVRIVAATHVDLEAAVAKGRFRQDLYFRLAVVQIDVPPLRERRGDVPALAAHFLDRLGARGRRLSPAALSKLEAYAWPGNLRELRNAIERALVLGDGDVLGPELFRLGAESRLARGFTLPPEGIDLESLERDLLHQALERAGGNRTRAAALLGLTRDAVRYRLGRDGREE